MTRRLTGLMASLLIVGIIIALVALIIATLTTNLAASYAELARLHANLDSAKSAVEIRRQTADLFAKRQANGLETRGSLRQVEARLASAQAEQIAIEESIALQQNQLAALMGGVAGVSSELGVGTTITVTFPVQQDESFA